MRDPPRILVVDDNPSNLDILDTRLTSRGYEVVTATDGEEALARVRTETPDLVLLDIMMPKIDGIEVCRRIKSDTSLPFTPVIMVTAKADSRDIVAGLEAGGDDYLTKPVDQAALVARVKSMLRIKALHDMVEEQNEKLADWNRSLEDRVAAQLGEIERIGRLKRFLPPQVADAIVSADDEKVLESHRREISVVFCDLRNFTEFSSIAEPEDAMRVLGQYYVALGNQLRRFEATIGHFAGDGLMAFFNDPLPCPDHATRAVCMAAAMRDDIEKLMEGWKRRGLDLGFGIGIASGYATLGHIGTEDQFHYTAIGSVVNLASRLCDEAESGDILISEAVHADAENSIEVEPGGERTLKGFPKPVSVLRVAGLRETAPKVAG